VSTLFELDNIAVERAGRPILEQVSMTLMAGERLALVGAIGTGKTTLLRTLVGLEKPTKGRIIAFGTERRVEKDFREVRTRAGLLFQHADDQLFSPTVIEDVAFGPLNLGLTQADAVARAGAALEYLNLSHLSDRITHQLSGGEKRLVSLATVLAMEPQVLLLDEPTNALDDAHLACLIEILVGLDIAMVIVSHDRVFLETLATRAVVLKNGHLAPTYLHRHVHVHDHIHVHGVDVDHDHDHDRIRI
jgi:cobalt/nickel transport system ATP-binding protein